MRFLLDTNVLIPLEDSKVALGPSLASLVRLACDHGHPLLYHPASERDIHRDKDLVRRGQTLDRLQQYARLDHIPACPWNRPDTYPNEAADNEILYAISIEAAKFLVTEDLGIHKKAKAFGLDDRVLTIQMAANLLRRLHERTQARLPNISEVPLHAITNQLSSDFFNSLREGYPAQNGRMGFDDWFREKARDGRQAWVCTNPSGALRGLCVFAIQENQKITDDGIVLPGLALKLCTFKVGDEDRGQKIGELMLKAAFQYATKNGIENLFITADEDRQQRLVELLEDFGFTKSGHHGRDAVYVKHHPVKPPSPNAGPVEYHRAFFPHYMDGETCRKFIVPVVPEYHQILFPDYHREGDPQPLFDLAHGNPAGNAIKLAYLCHGNSNQVRPGDLVLFYRSADHKSVTTVGIVERFETLSDADAIIGLVRRRTVYSMKEIEDHAAKPTKVTLFRLARHLDKPVRYPRLIQDGVLNGPPQSIMQITHDKYLKLMDASRG